MLEIDHTYYDENSQYFQNLPIYIYKTVDCAFNTRPVHYVVLQAVGLLTVTFGVYTVVLNLIF